MTTKTIFKKVAHSDLFLSGYGKTHDTLNNLNHENAIAFMRGKLKYAGERREYAFYSNSSSIGNAYKFRTFISANNGNLRNHFKVGKVMEAAKAYCDSVGGFENSSMDGFLIYYFNFVKTPVQFLTALKEAVEMHDKAPKEEKAYGLTLLKALNIFSYFVIDQSYNGVIFEMTIIKMLEDYYAEVDRINGTFTVILAASDEHDRRYGVDIEVWRDGKIVGAYQVKPLSYFLGTHWATERDRNDVNPKKYAAYYEKFGARVQYIDADTSIKCGKLRKFDTRKCKAYVKKVQAEKAY